MCFPSTTFAAEVLVEAIENRAAVCQPFFIVPVGHREARDQRLDARDLRPAELTVLQVDVVNDLRDGTERRIVEPEACQEDLEGALVPIVRELGLEHVEAELAGSRRVTLRDDELEARIGVDEAPDQPRAPDPVDVDTLASDPDAAAELFQAHTAAAL